MTAPPPPVQPATPAQNQSSMIPVILASIAAYLALKQVVKGPWRNVAAVAGLTAVAGNALDRLARRGMGQLTGRAGKDATRGLWGVHDRAVAAGVDVGMEGLVKVILGVQDRLDEARARVEANNPDRPPDFDPDNPSPATVLPRPALINTAADLVDAVIYATQNTAAQLTANWSKTWRTREDERVRPSHRALNGVTIPALDPFPLDGGGEIRYPHDPRAPLSEVINCRCSLTFIYQKASAGGPTPALVPAGPSRDRLAASAHLGSATHWVRVHGDP